MSKIYLAKNLQIAMALALLAAGCATQPVPKPKPQAVPVQIDRAEAVSEIPVAMRGGKLFIKATLAGHKSEFIFDTGTPTMIAKTMADKLNLPITGQNTGRDAHGQIVKMAKTVVPKLSLGGLTLRQVPALVFDFSSLELGPCFFGAGVIGSEVLTGSAWRLSRDRLIAADTAQKLPKLSAKAISTQLITGDYPYPPIVKARFGDLEDFALFDTGNRNELALYAPVAKKVTTKDVRKGFGSAGVSAGGRAADRPLTRMTVTNVAFGKQPLGPLRATTRTTPPTLLGAGLLDRFDIVLDYLGNRFVLDPKQMPKPSPKPSEPGYAITIVKGQGKVTQLFHGSRAEQAGLKLGDHVIAVNGRKLSFPATTTGYQSPKCAAARWLAWEFNPAQPAKITVMRSGTSLELAVP